MGLDLDSIPKNSPAKRSCTAKHSVKPPIVSGPKQTDRCSSQSYMLVVSVFSVWLFPVHFLLLVTMNMWQPVRWKGQTRDGRNLSPKWIRIGAFLFVQDTHSSLLLFCFRKTSQVLWCTSANHLRWHRRFPRTVVASSGYTSRAWIVHSSLSFGMVCLENMLPFLSKSVPYLS